MNILLNFKNTFQVTKLNTLLGIVLFILISCTKEDALVDLTEVAPEVIKTETTTHAKGSTAPYKVLGLSNWKLQLLNNSGNIYEIKEGENTDLNTYNQGYFISTDSNNGAQFTTPSEGNNIGNTSYTRTELRHLTEWNVNENKYRYLEIHAKVTQFSNARKVVFMQVHDGSNDMLTIMANGTNNKYRLQIDGDAVKRGADDTDQWGYITLNNITVQENTTFKLKIRTGKGRIRIDVSGPNGYQTAYNETVKSQGNSGKWHFKGGSYLVGSDDNDGTGKIQFYKMKYTD